MTGFPYHPPARDTRAVSVQPDRVDDGGNAGSPVDVLWWIGGGIMAILLLGFALSRRFHQRPADSPFDTDREGSGPSSSDEEPLEGLL